MVSQFWQFSEDASIVLTVLRRFLHYGTVYREQLKFTVEHALNFMVNLMCHSMKYTVLQAGR
jgi:hypothetical protein